MTSRNAPGNSTRTTRVILNITRITKVTKITKITKIQRARRGNLLMLLYYNSLKKNETNFCMEFGGGT